LKTNLFGLFVEEIALAIKPHGLPKYRAAQIAAWIYGHGINEFQHMTNLPVAQRLLLTEFFIINTVSVRAEQHSVDHKTSKYLLAFPDEVAVETVLMRQHYGNSVCVSTQVGCAMGCTFCASTLQGVTRDLTGGEILAQVLYLHRLLAAEQSGVNTIVIMGSGEPLANYNNVLRFIRLCHEHYCMNLSYRNFTLSTCGLIPGMNQLADEGLPINLSISLHAPNNALRTNLMPVNKRYPLESVIAAADHYAAKTGRRVTYEYTLIANVNDTPEDAIQLSGLMKGHLASVNLIPVNPVPERGLLRPSNQRIVQFEQILQSRHINVTVRREMGVDIQAACGQLRHEVLGK
jgi:23S rRNA (adenine2503-C2)-methyltransferase